MTRIDPAARIEDGARTQEGSLRQLTGTLEKVKRVMT